MSLQRHRRNLYSAVRLISYNMLFISTAFASDTLPDWQCSMYHISFPGSRNESLANPLPYERVYDV